MTTDLPTYAGPSAGRRIYGMLAAFPAVCFLAALVTDLAYWKTAEGLWETFSVWLIAGGLVMAAVAALVGLVDWFASARGRGLRPAWPALIGNTVAVLLSILNVFVHSRDGWTAVIPTGLILSAVVALILLFTGWSGWGAAYRNPLDGAE